MRIEYLERIAGALEYEIKSNRDNLENAKENLEEAKTDKDDFQYYKDRVDEFEAWVQVGESLMAELEKRGCRTKVRQLRVFIQHKTPSFEKPGVCGIISLCY